MALSSYRALILVTLSAATVLFPMAMATQQFIVGDDKGWTTGVDYQAWARDKVFHVGDIIEFEYPSGQDNVVIVNSTNFKECRVPPEAPVFSSGHDAFEFVLPGPRFYISGFGDHCQQGQKLAFYVFPNVVARPPIPASPLPSPPAPAPFSEPPAESPLLPPAPAPAPSGFSNFARSVTMKMFKV